MGKILSSLGIILMASSTLVAQAYARPNTTKMSCQQTQDMVHRTGAIVLTTGPRTYDRFVSSGAYCAFGEYVDTAFVRTRDQRSCYIGYRCVPNNPFPLFDD